MELGDVLGLQGVTMPSTRTSENDLRSSFTPAASYSYPSPFLDEQKMLRFSKTAHTLPPGMDFGRPNEQRYLLSRTKIPFTPSQWIELEHQALIYKYLDAKAPIPSSLLIAISKNFRSSSTRRYKCKQNMTNLHIMPVGLRPLYQDFTNANSDPEPGRCRRTDGKKWRCSKEAMAEHKYCERHINRNRHRSRKPVENQTRKTTKETPDAGSLAPPVSQGSFKKAKVNELKLGSVSYWTNSLNRKMLSTEKANKPGEDNNAPLLSSTNRHPTLSLLCQMKQQNKPDKSSTTIDCGLTTSNTMLKPWESSNQQNSANVSCTPQDYSECLQSVLQNCRLLNNEKIKSQKSKVSNHISAESTFYSSPEGQHMSCLATHMARGQGGCISNSGEMPQGGPLGEILTNSKNTEDLTTKCQSISYGWLLNLENHEM